MGVYVYGVSSKNRKVKNLPEPVFFMKYLFKPSMFRDNPPLWDAWVARYESAPSKKNCFVAYDPTEDGYDYPAFDVYIYTGNYNTFYDSQEDLLKKVGYAYKVGKRFVFTEYYDEVPEEYREYVIDNRMRKSA